MLRAMAFRDDPRGWARAQAKRLRSDPKGWAQEQTSRLRHIVDVAPFSDEALTRELARLRERVEHLGELAPEERQALHDELLVLHERLTPGGALTSGAKIGFAASVLPVIGLITGPVIGSAYGVYRSQRLTEVRSEIQEMLRRLARGA